ncbi:MAG: S-4TM family putative pore-forming effector [Bacteroidales bacterium]
MKIDQQNTEKNIRLLSSQRYFYSQAKKIRILKLFCVVVLVIISPIVLLIFPLAKDTLCFIGAFGIILTFIIDFIENSNIKRAANIQEQFDTEVFGLDWNAILLGKKEPIEIIIDGDKKFKGDKTNLYNWYGDLQGIDYPYNVLVCQRSNLVWDWRLRKKFAVFMLILLTIIILTGIIFGLVSKLALKTYLMGILIPSIPAIIFGLKEVIEHFRISNEKSSLMSLTNSLIDKNYVPNSDLRNIQDRIYDLRTKGAIVPDWFYNKYRNEYEQNLHDSNQDFLDKLKIKKN